MKPDPATCELWPPLPWEEWNDTAATLHMWMQIVGETRLAKLKWLFTFRRSPFLKVSLALSSEICRARSRRTLPTAERASAPG